MQGSIALRNEVRAMAEAPPIEFIYSINALNTVEAVTADLTLYFQKAFIYPARGVNGSGVISANTGPVSVGKSGKLFAVTLTSLTHRGSIATATRANHGFRPGMSINHTGATPAGYNVLQPVFNVTANTYEFQLAADPGGPASVLPNAARVQYLPDVLGATDLPIKYELPTGLKMRLADLVVSGAAGDGVLIQAW